MSYHELPPPLSLAAVVVGSCDPAIHSSHGYFWHLAAGGYGGVGGGGTRLGLGGARLGDSAVAIGRDRTGIGCGVVFFVAPAASGSAAPPQLGGGAAATSAALQQQQLQLQPLLPARAREQAHAASSGFRVTGAVLWDGRKPSAAGDAAAAAAAGPAPLAARGTAPATAKATELIQRLVAGTRAQPLSGGPEGAAFALEAAAHAVLSAAMPTAPCAGWLAVGEDRGGAEAHAATRLVGPSDVRADAAAAGAPSHNDLLSAAAEPGASDRGSGRPAGLGAPKLQLVHIATPALASAGLGGGSATGSYSARRFT